MNESNKKLRVLLCDDDETSLLLLRTVLEKHGFEIVGEAMSGLEAVNMYDDLKPDLVLLDINMPKGGGVTTLRFMRELNKTPQIIMLTGDSSKFHVQTTKKLGSNDYLLKSSVQKPDFLERIRVMCTLNIAKDEEEQKENEPPEQAEEKNKEQPKEGGEAEGKPKRPVRRMVRPDTEQRRRR